MAIAVQNERMLPIASIVSHVQIRRSLVGALATDPIVPERRRRTRRLHTTHANEGAQTA